jgi:hypothetical protein
MKGQRWSRGIALLFNLGARWGGWLTPRPGRFIPGKETRYLFYRRLGGSQGRSGRVRNLTSAGIRCPDSQACGESLYRLQGTQTAVLCVWLVSGVSQVYVLALH